MVTWDILKHYGSIDVNMIKEQLDLPSNGIVMEHNVHEAWDLLKICLQETKVRQERIQLSISVF